MPVAPMTAPKKTRRTLLTLTVPPPLYWSTWRIAKATQRSDGYAPGLRDGYWNQPATSRMALIPPAWLIGTRRPEVILSRSPQRLVCHYVSRARVEVGRNRLRRVKGKSAKKVVAVPGRRSGWHDGQRWIRSPGDRHPRSFHPHRRSSVCFSANPSPLHSVLVAHGCPYTGGGIA